MHAHSRAHTYIDTRVQSYAGMHPRAHMYARTHTPCSSRQETHCKLPHGHMAHLNAQLGPLCFWGLLQPPHTPSMPAGPLAQPCTQAAPFPPPPRLTCTPQILLNAMSNPPWLASPPKLIPEPPSKHQMSANSSSDPFTLSVY